MNVRFKTTGPIVHKGTLVSMVRPTTWKSACGKRVIQSDTKYVSDEIDCMACIAASEQIPEVSPLIEASYVMTLADKSRP